MKVAMLIDSLAHGGAERQVLYHADGLARRGHEVELIYYYNLADQYDYSGIEGMRFTLIPKKGRYVRFLLELARYLKPRRYDVLYSCKSVPPIYAALAGRWAGIPVIVGGYRAVYKDKGVIRLAHRFTRGLVTSWVANTRAGAASVMGAIGVRPDRCFVVYNGIDTDRFNADQDRVSAKLRVVGDADRPVVAFIGRLHEAKAPLLFVEMAARALRRAPNIQFLIIGDGELRTEVEQRVAALSVSEQIRLLGMREDIPYILAATDVCVCTSPSEGLSNALLEALACGVPIVSTCYDSVVELFTDGVEGLTAPIGDVDALAEAVCRLIDDPQLRRRMGAAGRQRAVRQFSLGAMVSGYLDVYIKCHEIVGLPVPACPR